MSTAPFGCGCANLNESHGTSCRIIREMKQTAAERREEYFELLRARQAQLGTETAVDVPHRLQKLGVPADLILAIRNPGHTRSLDAARRALAAPRSLVRALLLVGAHGCGKSTAAAFVMADAVKHWDWGNQPSGGKELKPFVWAHASEVTNATAFGKVDSDWMESAKGCRVLVLDDLGKDGTTAGLGALRDLLVHRHEKQRLTVVTSNMAPTDFEERYGASWYERLKVAAIVPDLRAEKSLRRAPQAPRERQAR